MKYVLVFLVIFLVAWRWRSARTAEHSEAVHKKAAAKALPVDVVACAHCGVHVPLLDAIDGTRGMYCSHAHRTVAEA